MGGLFVSSTSVSTGHGVFAIKSTPTTQIRATGTSRVAIVGQFPWGPIAAIQQHGSQGEAKQFLAPLGMTRTGYAYLALLCGAFPDLVTVRVAGSDAVKATATVNKTGPVAMLTLTAKYEGVEGNNLVAVVSAATDGDANHKNLSVSVTGPNGVTTDLIENLNYSGIGADSTFTQAQLDKLQLIGAPTKTATGVPLVGTYTFSTGTNGTINSAAYVGTASSGDKGIASLESDDNIRHVTCDYPGSSLIAAVNAGLVAHAALKGDRSVYLNGIPAQTAAAVQTDVALYRGVGLVYCDPWAYIFDDTTQAEQLVPPGPFGACVNAQLSPSTSGAWKATEVQRMLSAIRRLETARGQAKVANTNAGISTIIGAPNGGFVFEAMPNTIAPSDPTQAEHTTFKMDVYIAKSFVTSVYGTVDAPNVETNRDDISLALNGFMSTLKSNAKNDPNHNPHVIDFDIPSLTGANTPQDYAAGDVKIPLQVQYSNGIKRLFLVLKSGTSPLTVKTQ
jgi:hypothetical protein